MKTKLKLLQSRIVCAVALGIGSNFSAMAATDDAANRESATTSEHAKLVASTVSAAAPQEKPSPAIPWSQVGARAGGDYKGDGLGVTPISEGARLRCVFQRLEGEATREGLWLTSTATNLANDRFRIVAAAIGRLRSVGVQSVERGASGSLSAEAPAGFGVRQSSGAFEVSAAFPKRQGTAAVRDAVALPKTGTVSIDGQTVRFIRPSLVEEYTVCMDGVRQDFVVPERPAGSGELQVRLAVTGALVEPTACGALLVLEHSGRKIAYSRLKATDATGRQLPARMEILKSNSEIGDQKSELAVLVDDTNALYPIRIDPTFSDANWVSMGGFPGTDDPVRTVAVDASGNLYIGVYIGGGFTIAGEVFVTNIAKWDGNAWSGLSSGMNGGVGTLAASGNDLYAGGGFTMAGGTQANNIAKWNGTNWSALGQGVYGGVFALAVSGGNVYAGGSFTTAGGTTANSIAKWNGSSWSALGSGVNGDVYAVAVSGGNVYAAGSFTTAGGIVANNIAKWDGSSWSALGSGMSNSSGNSSVVYALAVSGTDLYSGGGFAYAGGNEATGIAKWDGSTWSALGSGVNGGRVAALAVSGSDLYAAGAFTMAGGIVASHIAKWDGSGWSTLGSGMNGGFGVDALVASGSNLYAGGDFTLAGESPAHSIAQWNGSVWSGVGTGALNEAALVVAVSGSNIYVGGRFTGAGNSAANYITKWDGNGWSTLGSGMNDAVRALVVSGSDLYAGGYFTRAGGITASNIARWDGNAWSALGSGLNSYVYALAVSGSNLYAGGDFTMADGIPANHIAKWDGNSWSPLGSGTGGVYGGYAPDVLALAWSGTNLYAGGNFTIAGGSPASYIARWDGSSWSALGSGVGGCQCPYEGVYALAVSGNDLYVGGNFTVAGGSPANRIAKWNGSSWSALGSGVGGGPYVGYEGIVFALAVSGSDLYAGGYFFTAGGSPANHIAKWNGSRWSALGSGVADAQYPHQGIGTLGIAGSNLYVGGNYTIVGGKVSAYIAKAILPPQPPVLSIEPDGFGGYFIRFTGSPGTTYRLQRAPGVTGPWISSALQTAPASGLVEFWDLFPPPGKGFYRAVQP